MTTTDITLRCGKKVQVSPGDTIFVTIDSEDESVVVRGRFIDKTDNVIQFSVINPEFKFINVSVKENRVVKTERPN